jgi:hypothetical protein
MRLSFEGHREIVSLLEASGQEFEKGNKFAALRVLLEAQSALSEMFQTEIEQIESGNLRSLLLLQSEPMTSPRPEPLIDHWPWYRLSARSDCHRSR